MIRLRSRRIKIAKTSLVLSLIQVCLVVALRLNIIIEVMNPKSNLKYQAENQVGSSLRLFLAHLQ